MKVTMMTIYVRKERSFRMFTCGISTPPSPNKKTNKNSGRPTYGNVERHTVMLYAKHVIL